MTYWIHRQQAKDLGLGGLGILCAIKSCIIFILIVQLLKTHLNPEVILKITV